MRSCLSEVVIASAARSDPSSPAPPRQTLPGPARFHPVRPACSSICSVSVCPSELMDMTAKTNNRPPLVAVYAMEGWLVFEPDTLPVVWSPSRQENSHSRQVIMCSNTAQCAFVFEALRVYYFTLYPSVPHCKGNALRCACCKAGRQYSAPLIYIPTTCSYNV